MQKEQPPLEWKKWSNESIDSSILEQIQTAWKDEAGENEFHAEMSTIFGGILEEINLKEPDNEYLALYENEIPRAVLELIDTRRGTMTKLLTLHLSPSYWDSPSPKMLSEVYTAAILATIEVGVERAHKHSHQTHQIKIYGRYRELLDILRTISDNWEPQQSFSSCQMEGRWLTINFQTQKTLISDKGKGSK